MGGGGRSPSSRERWGLRCCRILIGRESARSTRRLGERLATPTPWHWVSILRRFVGNDAILTLLGGRRRTRSRRTVEFHSTKLAEMAGYARNHPDRRGSRLPVGALAGLLDPWKWLGSPPNDLFSRVIYFDVGLPYLQGRRFVVRKTTHARARPSLFELRLQSIEGLHGWTDHPGDCDQQGSGTAE